MKYFIEILTPIYEVKEVVKQSFPSLKQAMKFCCKLRNKNLQIKRNDVIKLKDKYL